MKFIFTLQVLMALVIGNALAQMPDSAYIRQNYDKTEVTIPMRDGVKLFTSIYTPKDKSKAYPFLMQRACYIVAQYGADEFPRRLGPNKCLMRDGYIFVYRMFAGDGCRKVFLTI